MICIQKNKIEKRKRNDVGQAGQVHLFRKEENTNPRQNCLEIFNRKALNLRRAFMVSVARVEVTFLDPLVSAAWGPLDQTE